MIKLFKKSNSEYSKYRKHSIDDTIARFWDLKINRVLVVKIKFSFSKNYRIC